MNSKIITKGLGITLITAINCFSVLPILAQEANCSNYWINPNTGETECFENLNFNRATNAIDNRARRATLDVRTTLTTKEKLDIYCESTYSDVNLILSYASNAMNAINLEYRSPIEQKNVLRLANRVVKKAKRYNSLCQSSSGTATRAGVAYRELKASSEALQDKVGNIK